MDNISVLFVSTYCSDEKYNWVCSLRTKQNLDPAQRMFKGVIEGLNFHDCDITCVSALPFGTSNTTEKFFEKTEETVNGIKFIYLGFRLGKIKRLIDLHINVKKEMRQWLLKTEGRERIVICDSLQAMCSGGARKLAQKNHIKTIAYVTDYPSMATSIKKREHFIKRSLQTLFDKYADKDLKKYDAYILVAEKLKELIGFKNKSYLVIEDIITIPSNFETSVGHRDNVFQILYGGALCARFGVNRLVDAVTSIKDERLRLIFYGSGESVEYIRSAQAKDERIQYRGIVSFDELQKIQKNVDILVNPRPTDEKFAAYSFPSKTLSYMLSGTPVLSTRIPGIPSCYEPYLYWFDDEDVASMARKIQEIINYPKTSLQLKGKKAYEYAVREKNSTVQTAKILDFIKGIVNG